MMIQEDFSGVAGNISFAAPVGLNRNETDPSVSVTGGFKREKFSRKHRFQCTFCFGKNCSKELWTKTKG